MRLTGTPGKGGAKPLATVSGTLWFGFILAAVFYIWFEIIKVPGLSRSRLTLNAPRPSE